MGKQVAILYWGATHLAENIEETRKKPDHRYVGYYQQAARLMEEDETVRREIGDIVRKAEEGDRETLKNIRTIYTAVLAGITESLGELNIAIDEFVEESQFVLDGSAERVIERLRQHPHTGTEEGALFLDLEPFGIHGRDTKFFITRGDGTSLYATRDVAYHLWKAQQADLLVNVLGEDHKLEATFVKLALTLLDSTPPETLFYAFVSLPEGKMSTRKGRVVYLDDLLSEAKERARQEVFKRRGDDEYTDRIVRHVAVGAIRYNILKVRASKPIVFKWEDALNFEGQSAPFIQYAHARCCAILRQKAPTQPFDADHVFAHESECSLVTSLALFPEVVRQAVDDRNPAAVADYAHLLAQHFNAFYRDCRVIGSDAEQPRLALVAATRQTLANALRLLGIEPLERM
jgi:arginyl-tRNA synthetase